MNAPCRSALILHGLGGGPYELAPLIEAIRREGVLVEAPALPGHDVPGPIMPSSTWDDWLGFSDRMLDAIVERGRPAALIGFSTGATLALELSRRRPADVDRLVLICPFLAIRHFWFYGLRPEAYLKAPWTRWLEHVPRRPPAVRDPAARRAVNEAASSQRYLTFNLSASRSALELIERAREHVSEVTAPALVVQARLDSVVQPEDASWLVDHLGSGEKELVWLDRSDHLASWDHDREVLIGRVLEFLGRGPDGP